jgi:hypothetical protein
MLQEKEKILREISEREDRLEKEKEAKDKLLKQIQVMITQPVCSNGFSKHLFTVLIYFLDWIIIEH